MLTVVDKLSDEILGKPARQLYKVLEGPTLVHLSGKIKRPLFISVLQHGNEDTGWEVIRRLLHRYRGRTLPRSLSVFIGNVRAARYGKRKLQRQPDFNRVWDGGESEEALTMQQVIDSMRERRVFASIDIHNNSGFNPHYACINRLTPGFLHLAKQFSRTIVYFIRPRGVQSMAFAELCPAVTLECGQPGDEYGIQLALKYVDAVLNQTGHKKKQPAEHEFDLYHTVAVVKIPDQRQFSFDGSKCELQFIKGLEQLNFEEIAAGSKIATIAPAIGQPFHVYEESGNDIFDSYFAIDGEQLLSRAPVIPSMLSSNIPIVRQDCLCYLMERYDLTEGEI